MLVLKYYPAIFCLSGTKKWQTETWPAGLLSTDNHQGSPSPPWPIGGAGEPVELDLLEAQSFTVLPQNRLA